MPAERRGQAIRVMIKLVNWRQEEPAGYGGGRQLSVDGTSRVSREAQARFREGLGVKLPGATRPESRLLEQGCGAPAAIHVWNLTSIDLVRQECSRTIPLTQRAKMPE